MINCKGLSLDTLFTSYADSRASKMLDSKTEYYLKYDVYAPDKARVNYILRHFEEFHRICGIEKGD